MTKFPEWTRLHEAVAFLAYDCTGERLDAWAYPGASVGLSLEEATLFHWRPNPELSDWLRAALVRSGKLRGSWKANAPSLGKMLFDLRREVEKDVLRRMVHEDFDPKQVVAHLKVHRADLLAALAEGEMKAWGIPADGSMPSRAIAIPTEAFQAPIELTHEGHIRCGLTASELILWRDVVVRRADLERLWPEIEANEPNPAVAAPQSGADVVAEWMLANQTSAHEAGRRMKRDDALRLCMDATKCSYGQALNAWIALPDLLRGARGRPRKT